MNIRSLFCSLALSALALTQASANTVTLGASNSNYRVGNGGEFNWIPNGGNPGGLGAGYAASALLGSGFESFCIQYGEYISFGSTYEYAISDRAKGPTGEDKISVGTAWLYSQFATGTLTGYNYTPGASRAATAGELQKAIWFLEGEIGTISETNVFYEAATEMFSSDGATADANGSYGVFALNLGPVGTSQTAPQEAWSNQDQLVYRGVPDGGMTLALLGLGLLGLALAKRRS